MTEKDILISTFDNLINRLRFYLSAIILFTFVTSYLFYNAYFSYRHTYFKDEILKELIMERNDLDSIHKVLSIRAKEYENFDFPIPLEDSLRSYAGQRYRILRDKNMLANITYADIEIIGTGIKISVVDFQVLVGFILLIFLIGVINTLHRFVRLLNYCSKTPKRSIFLESIKLKVNLSMLPTFFKFRILLLIPFLLTFLYFSLYVYVYTLESDFEVMDFSYLYNTLIFQAILGAIMLFSYWIAFLIFWRVSSEIKSQVILKEGIKIDTSTNSK